VGELVATRDHISFCCEFSVDALLCLGKRLFLAVRHSAQGDPQKEGQVGARWVDAGAPLRPLTPRYNLVSAILEGFCGRHKMGLIVSPRLLLRWGWPLSFATTNQNTSKNVGDHRGGWSRAPTRGLDVYADDNRAPSVPLASTLQLVGLARIAPTASIAARSRTKAMPILENIQPLSTRHFGTRSKQLLPRTALVERWDRTQSSQASSPGWPLMRSANGLRVRLLTRRAIELSAAALSETLRQDRFRTTLAHQS
jgi:hypothetical protein